MMKRWLTVLCLGVVFGQTNAQHEPYSLSSGQAIAIDETTGDIYLAGFTLTEKPGKIPDSYDPDRFRKNVFISKFDKQGKQLWLETLETPEEVDIRHMLVDASGHTYVTGQTRGSLERTNQGEYDAFLAKYDIQGEQQWLRQFGTSLSDQGSALTLRDTGEIILVGRTYTILEENAKHTQGIPPETVFLGQWRADGSQQWLNSFAIPEREYISAGAVVIDSQGNAFVSGGTAVARIFPEPTGKDVYVARFNASGDYEWHDILDGYMQSYSGAITVDKTKVYVTGISGGGLGEKDYEDGSGLSIDAFLAAYDINGNKQWVKEFGAEDGYAGQGVAVDTSGNAVVVGYGNGTLGGSKSGASDAFIIQYNTEGERVWADRFGTGEFDEATQVTVDSKGYIYFTGYLYLEDRNFISPYPPSGRHVFLTKYAPDGRQMWLRTFKSQAVN